MKVFCISALLAVSLVTSLAAAGEKTNFSGEWVLDVAHSTLAIKDVSAGTVRIVHQEPMFKFSRIFVKGRKPDEVEYELTTDGIEKTTKVDGMTTRSRLYWDGDQLVLDETILLGDRRATNVVHYSLTDGGKTLTARESFRGPRLSYDNTWVFSLK